MGRDLKQNQASISDEKQPWSIIIYTKCLLNNKSTQDKNDSALHFNVDCQIGMDLRLSKKSHVWTRTAIARYIGYGAAAEQQNAQDKFN